MPSAQSPTATAATTPTHVVDVTMGTLSNLTTPVSRIHATHQTIVHCVVRTSSSVMYAIKATYKAQIQHTLALPFHPTTHAQCLGVAYVHLPQCAKLVLLSSNYWLIILANHINACPTVHSALPLTRAWYAILVLLCLLIIHVWIRQEVRHHVHRFLTVYNVKFTMMVQLVLPSVWDAILAYNLSMVGNYAHHKHVKYPIVRYV